ncbi:MAG: hypothetical protein MSS66_09525 [Selenomonadaceae bacterium]|nr:hypothetical protein [Selenomonadaceae bacterium]
MLDIGKYSLKVSPYHLYKRATLRRLLVVFREIGEEKTIKEINNMIDRSAFSMEMQDKYKASMYLRETTDEDWARFVLEDNNLNIITGR